LHLKWGPVFSDSIWARHVSFSISLSGGAMRRTIDRVPRPLHRLNCVMIRIRHVEGVQRAVTAILCASYLLVLAMAASPALHEWLHGDADEADHQCAAVTAALGQLDRPEVDVAAIALPAPSWIPPRPEIYAIAVTRLFLLVSVLEHAPPTRG
jgi:hypothetical protein